MIHAALYARVSSTRQKQHETIDSQTACLREHAQARGWEIPEEWVFTDDGWSGASLVRPALERLRDLSAQRLVERVVCLSPDRLARNYAHQVLLVEEFTRNGTELVFIHNPVATTPEQALMVQFQGMIAEYERAQIAERTRRGKLHRARSGATSVLGRSPYGYRYLSRAEYGAAVYAVAEAVVVARIFHRYAAGGISMRALARELTADQIPSPKGNAQWDAGTLGRLLRNPAYMGRAAFGKTQAVSTAPRANRTSRLAGRSIPAKAGVVARPREEWIEIPVPALVSEEVFALVQRRLAENAKFSPRNTKTPALLQGLLVCDVCGYAYNRTSQGPGPKKYHYYRCPGTNGWELPGGIKVCTSRPLRADALDELIWEKVIALLSDPALVRDELERRLERMRDADPVQARQQRLHQEIATVEAQINRMVSAYQEELVTLQELRDRMPGLRTRRHTLQRQLDALAAQLVDQQAYLKLAENLEGFLSRLRESARTSSILDRQRVLRALVKEVRIGPDRITIKHSIPSTSSDPTPGYLLRCRSLNLVAAPARPALDAVVGIDVIWRGQPLSGRREVLALPPAHPLPVPVVLLGPGPAQDPHRGDLAQPGRSERVIDGIQEREPVPAHLLGPVQAGVVSLRETVVVDLGPVAVHPRRVDQRGQPVRGGRGQRFQCRPQRLADELHAVQRAHRGQHLCGIGPLPAPGPQQSRVGQPGQNHVQDPFLQPMREKPGPEASQDGEVEPRIIQLQAQQELPVHTGPYLVSGLPVGKTLRILQHRHQGQSTRRDRGPSLPGEGHREVIVPEHRTEHFPDPDGQSPLRERGPHHPSRQLRHPVIRPRLQRHPDPPNPPTTTAISKTNDTAPPESRLSQRSRERGGGVTTPLCRRGRPALAGFRTDPG